MTNSASADDRRFLEDFESGGISPAAFDHRAHIRLAYALLAEHDLDAALERMRTALQAFIARNGIPPSKYHETLTKSWILAVRHFMTVVPHAGSADEFIAANPILLDARIMLTHYSAEVLFSPEARSRFIEPDLQSIPEHG